jgi:hypothetical protein
VPSIDSLDVGDPDTKAWAEFAVQFSAARLQSWLLADLDAVAPGFFLDIQNHFDDAFSTADAVLSETGDDYVEIDTPTMSHGMDRESAEEFYRQLFPYAGSERDFRYCGRGLALVGLHSALETYAEALGVPKNAGEFPRKVQSFLTNIGAPLRQELFSALMVIDETRHVIVHHRGLVSARYIQNVPYCKLIEHERRVISDRELWRVGSDVWDIAQHLKRAVADRRG